MLRIFLYACLRQHSGTRAKLTSFTCSLSAFALVPVLAGLLVAGGCIFSTRDAENPTDEDTSWIVPDHPTKVFVNMQTGLESLAGTNYEKSLGTQFAFIPLPGDSIQFPGVFGGWNRLREIEFLNNLIGDADSISVEFTGMVPTQQDINFAQYEGFYDLQVVSKAASETTTYKAKVRFDLQEGSKGWELMKWEDIEAIAGFPSWGFLRATL